MKVLVTRGLADKMADETIVEPLANAYSTAVSKGQNYLYEEGFEKKLYDITMPFRSALIGGDLVDVADASLGENFRARVKSWKINGTTEGGGAVQVDQSIEIERSIIDE